MKKLFSIALVAVLMLTTSCTYETIGKAAVFWFIGIPIAMGIATLIMMGISQLFKNDNR